MNKKLFKQLDSAWDDVHVHALKDIILDLYSRIEVLEVKAASCEEGIELLATYVKDEDHD